jgi:hypothetical protein
VEEVVVVDEELFVFYVLGCMRTCICVVLYLGKRGGGRSSVYKDMHIQISRSRHK